MVYYSVCTKVAGGAVRNHGDIYIEVLSISLVRQNCHTITNNHTPLKKLAYKTTTVTGPFAYVVNTQPTLEAVPELSPLCGVFKDTKLFLSLPK